MGKIPSGLSDGVITSFGEYDQCLEIASPEIVDYDHRFKIIGKYCLVRPYLPFSFIEDLEKIDKLDFLNEHTKDAQKHLIKNNINILKLLWAFNIFDDKFYVFNLGICIPSPCTASDLQNALKQGGKILNGHDSQFDDAPAK